MLGTVADRGPHLPLIVIALEQPHHSVVHQACLFELSAGVQEWPRRDADELRPAIGPALDPIGHEPGSRGRAGDFNADHGTVPALNAPMSLHMTNRDVP
jgi:hypothetical protein